jgi:predicted LPLAT superfamily acyltransferase
MMLAEKIERGEFIAIAGDRIPVSRNPSVAFARFLGAQAPFPAGPYILASLLRCPAYVMFALRGGRGSAIYFEIFRDSICLPRQNRRDSLAALAADYAARLEQFCLSAPLQWFNFYDFWHLPVTDVADESH